MSKSKAEILIEGDNSDLKKEIKETEKIVGGMGSGIRNSFKSGMASSDEMFQSISHKAGQLVGVLKNPWIVAGAAAVAFGEIAKKIVKDSVEAAGNFEKGMANVSTLVDTSVVDMKKLSDGVVGMTTEVNKSASDLAEGLYQVISAGVDAEQSLDVLKVAAKSATAGLSTTEEAVNLLSASIKAYGMDWSKASYISDLAFKTVEKGQTTFSELANSLQRVAPIAANVGISIEELYAVFATLTGVTGGAAEVSTQLKAALSNILRPSEQAKELAKDLEIQFDATALQTKGLSTFMNELKNKVGDNKNAMITLFGSTEAYNAVSALAGAQAGAFSEKLAALEESAGSTDEAFQKQKDTYVETKKQIGLLVEKAKIGFGNELLPLMKSFLQFVIDNFPKIQQIIGEFIIEPIVATVDVIKTLVDWIKKAVDWFKELKIWGDKTGVVPADTSRWGVGSSMSGNNKSKQFAKEHADEIAKVAEEEGVTLSVAEDLYRQKIRKSTIPSFHSGGVMPWEGLAFLQKGETILPPGVSPNNINLSVTVTGNYIHDSMDVNRIGQVVTDTMFRKLRDQGAI